MEKAPQHKRLLEALGITFQDPELFYQALTHRSVLAEWAPMSSASPFPARSFNGALSYERLEFLGDSVLSLVVTSHLVNQPETFGEGALSQIRAKIVCEDMLAAMAKRFDLGECMLVGKGAGAAKKLNSILADGVEALIGAAFKDGGLPKASHVVDCFLGEILRSDLRRFLEGDYKTKLQEWTQKYHRKTPTYHLHHSRGPEHQKSFEVAVTLEDRELGRGEGTSLKRASQAAAQRAYQTLLGRETPSVTGQPTVTPENHSPINSHAKKKGFQYD